jgi:dTDP-4-amino-4,6-dideoxygalactose transaminase
MNDFGAEPDDLIREELNAIERVIRSGWWILGTEVESFEDSWAQRTGSAHAVGVANGMDAIEIGLRALGIGAGDEVITTPMTAFATVLAILRAGATPVLADIDPETAILDVASVERCLSPATRAVVLVHLYGQAGPVDELTSLCATHNLELIEDCAQAHGALHNGRPVGSFGAFGAWSFYPTKNLGTFGDGGALITDRSDLAGRARTLRNYGQSVRYVHTELGLNSRLDELHAAVLRVRLTRLDDWTTRRRATAQRYAAGIDHPEVHVLPLPAATERHVHHLFVITCRRRAELAEHLATNGVECLSHYPVPIHRQEPTRHLRVDPNGLPNAELHAATCLSIPCNPYLDHKSADQAIAAINSFARPIGQPHREGLSR